MDCQLRVGRVGKEGDILFKLGFSQWWRVSSNNYELLNELAMLLGRTNMLR
jgi:hypothetical protein